MKNILFITIIFLAVYSCNSTADSQQYVKQRIQPMEYAIIDGNRIQIIKIDGVEYILNSKGGIVKHSKTL